MNISFKASDEIFSLRSAALVIHDKRLLVVQNDRFDCFYIIGGGIQEQESSDKAVVRELYEETGYHFEIERLAFVQERFFKVGEAWHHEVVFFYLMREMDIGLQNGVNTDLPDEKLYWIPIEKLKNINLIPAFLKTAVKDIPNEITHIVSYE